MRYFFDDYAHDTERRELRRGAHLIPTAPQVFDLLDYLVRNRERVAKGLMISPLGGPGLELAFESPAEPFLGFIPDRRGNLGNSKG